METPVEETVRTPKQTLVRKAVIIGGVTLGLVLSGFVGALIADSKNEPVEETDESGDDSPETTEQ